MTTVNKEGIAQVFKDLQRWNGNLTPMQKVFLACWQNNHLAFGQLTELMGDWQRSQDRYTRNIISNAGRFDECGPYGENNAPLPEPPFPTQEEWEGEDVDPIEALGLYEDEDPITEYDELVVCTFVLPAGNTEHLQQVRVKLVDRFGGYTETDVKGGWRNGRGGGEFNVKGVKFEVAVPDADVGRLLEFALEAAAKEFEDELYFTVGGRGNCHTTSWGVEL